VSTLTIVLLVLVIVAAIAFVALYFLSRKAEKKQLEQQQQLEAMAQNVSMLVIDKKQMRFRDAGFPPVVMESVPKYLRLSKVFVVKAKIGPRVTTLLCQDNVFPLIPVKKEVKATISGIYITAVKGLRGSLEQPQPKKKGLFARFKKEK
jgi:uncharacterized protein YneF (UPF0154 family)